jgi:hypothetical protein
VAEDKPCSPQFKLTNGIRIDWRDGLGAGGGSRCGSDIHALDAQHHLGHVAGNGNRFQTGKCRIWVDSARPLMMLSPAAIQGIAISNSFERAWCAVAGYDQIFTRKVLRVEYDEDSQY